MKTTISLIAIFVVGLIKMPPWLTPSQEIRWCFTTVLGKHIKPSALRLISLWSKPSTVSSD